MKSAEEVANFVYQFWHDETPTSYDECEELFSGIEKILNAFADERLEEAANSIEGRIFDLKQSSDRLHDEELHEDAWDLEERTKELETAVERIRALKGSK